MRLVGNLGARVALLLLDITFVADVVLSSRGESAVRAVVSHGDVVQSIAHTLVVLFCVLQPMKKINW